MLECEAIQEDNLVFLILFVIVILWIAWQLIRGFASEAIGGSYIAPKARVISFVAMFIVGLIHDGDFWSSILLGIAGAIFTPLVIIGIGIVVVSLIIGIVSPDHTIKEHKQPTASVQVEHTEPVKSANLPQQNNPGQHQLIRQSTQYEYFKIRLEDLESDPNLLAIPEAHQIANKIFQKWNDTVDALSGQNISTERRTVMETQRARLIDVWKKNKPLKANLR